jgi:hypothetical protein
MNRGMDINRTLDACEVRFNNVIPFHMFHQKGGDRPGELVEALRKIKSKAEIIGRANEERRRDTGSSTKRSNQSSNEMSNKRISKMRDIKSEISELMGKIDNASKTIQDSFLTKKHEIT